MSPRSLSLRFAVSSGQTVELGKSRDADLLQRDLELPWREKVPRSQRRAQQTRLQEQRCPSRSLPNAFVFSCLPPSPRFPTSHCGWGATEERPGPGERISALKSRAPPAPQWGGGGNKLRGAEKGAPASKLLQQRDKQEVRLRGSAAGATPQAAALALGVRLASAGRREKTKQNRKKTPNNQKKKRTNRNKPNPRGMQCDNPKLEGPPGRRVEELGLQCGQQLSGHSSLHVTLQF